MSNGGFYFRCDHMNERHVHLTLFDGAGANCGKICIATEDLQEFRAKCLIGIRWGSIDIDLIERLIQTR